MPISVSVVVTLMGRPKIVGGLVWTSSWGVFSSCNSSQAHGWRKTVIASSRPPSSVNWLTISFVTLICRMYQLGAAALPSMKELHIHRPLPPD